MTETTKPRPRVTLDTDGKFDVIWVKPGQAVHHIDGNPRNNDIANLRIVDRLANAEHALMKGTE